MVSFIYSDKYYLEWPGHIFPCEKFRLLYEKLIREQVARKEDFLEPPPAKEEELRLVHPPEYLDRLRKITREPNLGLLEFEVPVSERVIEAFYQATGGTILASRLALQEKTGVMNLSGGFHHAFGEHGEGFCLLNDLAIAVRVMQKEKRIKRAMVIDCDLHQGNGTAHIFQEEPDVFTFSIHQENNYPLKQKSDLDIGLPDFTGDAEYLGCLKQHIPEIIQEHKPELIIYQAGADPYEQDQLGALKLTKKGLRQRDEFIINSAYKAGIPIAVTPGGGYALHIEDLIDIHYQTARVVKDIWSSGQG